MKKIFLNSLAVITSILFLTNCSNPELDSLKQKQKELDCKAEFSKSLLDHGTNIMLLGKEVGLQKELDEFHKIQSDTTASCDSIKKSWDLFQKLVDDKSKNIGK
jgi:hypothetical protein